MSFLSLIPEENKCVNNKESINSSSLKYPCVLSKKKLLHPLLSTTTMSISSNYNNSKVSTGDKQIARRILSAKDHRLKQLQNQLADAHFHLNELTNENRLLRNLQKRMDSALQRYEGVNGDIPKIFNSHNEEIRSWQVRFKQLKLQLKDTNQKLKDKDQEFQDLNDEHRHLLALSKDAKLYEREKLQQQVTDLNEKLTKHNETIILLQKRLNIEAKSYKQQLNAEIQKHKDTQTQLSNALNECEKLNSTIEKKDKIISSIIPKRSPKINALNFEKNSFESKNIEFKKDNFNRSLSINGNSINNNQVNGESSSVTDVHSNSTFTITKNENGKNSNNEKFEFDFSSDSNTSKTFKESNNPKIISNDYNRTNFVHSEYFESSNSNDTTQERVDSMKKQLSKKVSQTKGSSISNRNKRVPKQKNSNKINNPQTYPESSPEEIIDSSYEFSDNSVEKQNDNTLVPLLNLNRKCIEVDDEFIQNTHKDEFNIDDIDLKCQELEEKAAQERFLVENILDKYSNDIVKISERANDFDFKREKSVTLPDLQLKETKKSKSTIKHLEVNNNDKVSNRKLSSDLDEEKKRKLLATLKAIDRGEDDGLNFEGIRKIKPGNKYL